jgi:hypothetical protein
MNGMGCLEDLPEAKSIDLELDSLTNLLDGGVPLRANSQVGINTSGPFRQYATGNISESNLLISEY